MSAPAQAVRGRIAGAAQRRGRSPWDHTLLAIAGALLGLGLVMVTSASMGIADRHLGDPFHFFQRQLVFAAVGLGAGALATHVPLLLWQRLAPALLALAFVLLTLVLIPGVGREVNGSTRWLPLGLFQFQVSELVKLLAVVFLADFLVRRNEELRSSLAGFVKPICVLALLGTLLLFEPDFGAAVVLLTTGFGMMYLAGVRLWQFSALLSLSGVALAALAYFSPYRWARVVSFLNPWNDPYNSGFQLTQSLIAFGRGEWWGVGLGGSVQKLFYLPEAHTDFLFAVLAEELGLIGTVTVIALFTALVWRAVLTGARAERLGSPFAAYVAYGIGLWTGLQAFVNIGVNMGVLPTKGLTLPLMSYGGSSMVVTCLALGVLLRIGYESAEQEASAVGPRGGGR